MEEHVAECVFDAEKYVVDTVVLVLVLLFPISIEHRASKHASDVYSRCVEAERRDGDVKK